MQPTEKTMETHLRLNYVNGPVQWTVLMNQRQQTGIVLSP